MRHDVCVPRMMTGVEFGDSFECRDNGRDFIQTDAFKCCHFVNLNCPKSRLGAAGSTWPSYWSLETTHQYRPARTMNERSHSKCLIMSAATMPFFCHPTRHTAIDEEIGGPKHHRE